MKAPPTAGGWPQLWTSRYQNRDAIVASGFVPVGITLGAPRFRLGYELAARLRELAPAGFMFEVDDQSDFRRLYLARLHRLTVTRAAAILRELSEAHGGKPLVLLCFEDLTKPGEWCHRRLFAVFWEEETGEEVPEL
jgi:hypothetical protein